MKLGRVLRCTVFSIVLYSSAFSLNGADADVAYRVLPAAPTFISPAPVFTWTGLYVGVNAGTAFENTYSPTFVAGGLFPTSASNLVPGRSSGGTAFTGGFHAGYNWQGNEAVFGLETDLNWLAGAGNLNGTYATNTVAFGAAYPNYTMSGFDRYHWLGTLRGRLGFAFDQTLIYATGGLAYGQTDGGSITLNGTGPFPLAFGSSGNGWRTGWVIGGGVEYAIKNNSTIKIEYLRVGLGTSSQIFTGGALNYTVRHRNTNDIVRVGLNYKFGEPSWFVAARY